MVILPRLARALNAPAVAGVMGLVLVAVGIIGLVTDDIRARYAIVILIIGLINLVRTMSPGAKVDRLIVATEWTRAA